MKRLAIAAIVVGTATMILQFPRVSVKAQASPQSLGWLEGTVVSWTGRPPVTGGSLGVPIIIRNQSGEGIKSETHPEDLGGFYSFRDIKPGVYEVFVNASHIYSTDGRGTNIECRPQRVFGVVVAAGVRTKLDIVVNEGLALEEKGQPAIATESIINISQALARLQQQIDELKKK